jgi:putative DNA primase/helicase
LDIASLNLPEGGDAYDWLQRQAADPSALTLLLTQKDGDKELQAAIAHLLTLPLLTYERTYKELAKQLGMRATLLDQEVKAARSGPIEEKEEASMFPLVEPWDSPVDPGELLSELTAAFCRYAVLPPHGAEAVALWCVFTWFCEASHIAPLLVLRSPEKGCGKTTVLSIIMRLVYRPLPLSGVTAAVLFRVVDTHHPTVLIDEGDTFLNSKNQDMHGIINCGHSRDAPYVWRCVGDDHEPQCFDDFGPKAIAFIGRTRDTLHDRAVEVQLKRKLPHEKVSRLRNGDGRELEELARKLARFAQDYRDNFSEIKPELPESFPDRQADNWEPLVAIAMLAGDEWEKKAKEAALALTESKSQTVSMSVGVELVRDSYEIMKLGKIEKITDKELVDMLGVAPGSDWSTYNHGVPITRKQVIKFLHDFGIIKNPVRDPVRGDKVFRGYKIEQFEDAVFRYCNTVPDEAEENVTTLQTSTDGDSSVTNTKTVTVTQIPFVTRKPSMEAGCNDVTEISEGTGTSENTPTQRPSLRI